MTFRKGNKLGKGGRRIPPGGRPNKQEVKLKQAAQDRAIQLIEGAAEKVVKRYIRFAMKDAATCRHFMDKLIPDDGFDVPVGPTTIKIMRFVKPREDPPEKPKDRHHVVSVKF